MNPKVFFINFIFFWVFLSKKKLAGVNFCLATISLLFLPGSGYYQTVQANWRQPAVTAINLVIPPSASYPKNLNGLKPPNLTAQGVIIFDLPSSVIIFEKNPNSSLLPASTTKIMTALVAMEHYSLENVLTVPKIEDEGQDIDLVEGEKMTFENLLYALLVASANDAAETLVANYPGGKEIFINKMNEKAQSLSLTNTRFANPTGIDDSGQYTSAFDLVLLTEYALANPVFAKMVATPQVEIKSVDGRQIHEMTNINQLLGKITGVRGVKTGWTKAAGECLVTYIERDGRKIIIVVLGSQDRFGETEKLINWVFENFEWQQI